MMKIALVFPYPGFFPFANDTFFEHSRYESLFNEISEDEFSFEELVIPDAELNNTNFDCDVIISRGITAQTIKHFEKEIPVVEIPVAGNDLVKTLYSCKKICGTEKKIAVIGSQNMIYGVSDLSDVVGLNLKGYVKKSYTDGAFLVEQAIKEGFDFIVAGVGTCRYAEKRGYSSILIRSGKEAFWQALTEAKRVAIINRNEKEKTQRYITIMNYVQEGVVAIDTDGNINAFNEAAEQILGIKALVLIGQNFNETDLPDEFKNVIRKASYFSNDIVVIKNIHTTINKVPIKYKGNDLGTILTIQDITKIQKIEGDIRKKIYNKGHVAKFTFQMVIGKSPAFMSVIERAKQFSKVDSNILITGKTGTGKELFAQSIHNESKRVMGPFLAINCAAIPESLLESELFGYAPGAFTGALKEGKPGLFEMAHGGTIFLDEVGEIPPLLQSRLLRVLQEREVMRIGDDKIIPVEVKVIAATNKNLEKYVVENKFREDLYYRLNVLSLHLPSLNKRGNDLCLLAEQFLPDYSRRIHGYDMFFKKNAFEVMKRHDWNGNVRELKNFCERIVVLNNNKIISAEDIEILLSQSVATPGPIESVSNLTESEQGKSGKEKFLYQRISESLKDNNYNKQKTAESLGMSRTTLWRWIKVFGF